MLRLALVAALFAPVAFAGCQKEKPPSYAEQPLPPASGTPIGYLIDNSGQLELSAEQVEKLQTIDNSLSARNEAIDTQLREIEKPEPVEEDPNDKRCRQAARGAEGEQSRGAREGVLRARCKAAGEGAHAARRTRDRGAQGCEGRSHTTAK
jgi:hypothetical protein